MTHMAVITAACVSLCRPPFKQLGVRQNRITSHRGHGCVQRRLAACATWGVGRELTVVRHPIEQRLAFVNGNFFAERP